MNIKSENKIRGIIVDKLIGLADLLADPKPGEPGWRRSVKKGMDTFESIMRSKYGGKSLSPAKRRELRQKISELQDMIFAILGGESWAVIIYYMRKNSSKPRKRQTT